MPVISIIVPIYNVEKYLHRCLDSVFAQTLADYECILVDDGSPDNCSAICEEYVKKDKRFKVIHKKQNEGLPKARKSGLDIAIAEFVMHLDSDDWLEPNALELLYKKQQETDADIVMGSFRDVYRHSTSIYHFPEIEASTGNMLYFFLNRCVTLWSKLYKKALFDNILFPQSSIGEDAVINVQVFGKLETGKLQIINGVIYNHNCCSMSLTRVSKEKRDLGIRASITSRLWIENYLEDMQVSTQIKSAFQYSMFTSVIVPYLLFNKTLDKKEINLFYNKYYNPCMYKKRIRLSYRFLIHCCIFFIPAGIILRYLLNINIFAAKYIVNTLFRKR